MFQIDDKFLKDVGLGDLPEEQQQAFLAYFREQLELRVGTKLSDGLSDAQLAEFEGFIDRDMDATRQWVSANAAEYENDQVYQKLKAGAPATVSADDILAEYASLRWLSLNRPDYRDVVAATMEELRQEVIKNRDAILGNGPQAA